MMLHERDAKGGANGIAAVPRPRAEGLQTILSFDVEEHWRIEAAAGLTFDDGRKAYYAGRVAPTVDWILEALAGHDILATFFIVGELAQQNQAMVRAIQAAGHEVACHGWDHQRIHRMTPDLFREDIRRNKDVLEQIVGEAVAGYRAPTFSIVRKTAWALDVLTEAGFLYDSSIYPVVHDRYGVPQAPRYPFLAAGLRHSLLELPPVTLQVGRLKLPVGGGGFFRLLPVAWLEHALEQVRRHGQPPVAMLYFHPWEFDPGQARLPLGRLSRFRTYVGLTRNRARFTAFLSAHPFTRAVDVARQFTHQSQIFPTYAVAT
jgi:polysaccharide deacetylase family protein (PEP-CTERM system associated)